MPPDQQEQDYRHAFGSIGDTIHHLQRHIDKAPKLWRNFTTDHICAELGITTPEARAEHIRQLIEASTLEAQAEIDALSRLLELPGITPDTPVLEAQKIAQTINGS